MRKFASLVSAAVTGLASPALADVSIFDTPGAVQPPENVLFQAEDPMGSTAFGITNQTDTHVTFEGIESLLTPANGQAKIVAVDGGLDTLTFFLTNSDLGFSEVEFNLLGTHATATSVDLVFTDQFGGTFSDSFLINNGQNFFSALATDGQVFTNVSIMLDGDVIEMKQFRLGGIASAVIPEPATWAMMIAGFGLVGGALRGARKRGLAARSA